jgi:hypothetical protein
MFVRQNDNNPQGQFYQDSLLTKPTTSQSVLDNMGASFVTPFALVGDVSNMLRQKPEGNPLRDAVESVDIMNQTPGIGWGQASANFLGNIVGFGLNPINWGFGRIGTMGAEAVTAGAAKIAPEALSAVARTPLKELLGENMGKYIPGVGKAKDIPLSLAIMGEKGVSAFGTFAGAGVPQALFDNYHADTQHIEWGGVAKDMGKMGAFGLAIASVPFAWGVLKGKVGRATGKAEEELGLGDYQKAFEDGTINENEFNWIKDYLTQPLEAPNLSARASKILADDGHPVNMAENEVPFDIIKKEDIDNLTHGINDQVLSHAPEEYKTALSDFTVHNSIDALRENPKSLDGVRGYVDFINQKLKDKASKLAEADKILDDHLLKSVKENMPFSQKEIFKMMKKYGFETSHLRNMPMTVPENLEGIVKRNSEIAMLEKKVADYEKKISQGKQGLKGKVSGISKQIEQLKEKVPKILTPKEELQDIRQKLLTEKGLPKDWERSKPYHRLVDLAHVWHNARTLLDRVHLEGQYEKQEAFSKLASHVLKLADSDVMRFANRDNVVNYMKARIEGKVFKESPIFEAVEKARMQNEVPPDADTLLNEQDVEVNKSNARDLSTEFMEASDKFKEFKSSENIFKNLIQCVQGSLNG